MNLSESELLCKKEISSMLKKSQTKVIFPIIAYGLLKEYVENGKYEFTDPEIKKIYHISVSFIQSFIGHKLHTGGKYYDAYPIRNLPKYGILFVRGKTFEITDAFRECAHILTNWIPTEIKLHIDRKIGQISNLGQDIDRLTLATSADKFNTFIKDNISINPSNFEVFCFAIVKVHLEKFACKIYRDTRTASYDKGVDLSTNFGVVYQIKKLQLFNKKNAEELYSEIKLNFDSERMNDGKVVLIEMIFLRNVKKYLIDMKVQSLSKNEMLNICQQFYEVEDRMKVLRVIYDEFRREYESQI